MSDRDHRLKRCLIVFSSVTRWIISVITFRTSEIEGCLVPSVAPQYLVAKTPQMVSPTRVRGMFLIFFRWADSTAYSTSTWIKDLSSPLIITMTEESIPLDVLDVLVWSLLIPACLSLWAALSDLAVYAFGFAAPAAALVWRTMILTKVNLGLKSRYAQIQKILVSFSYFFFYKQDGKKNFENSPLVVKIWKIKFKF